MGQIRTKTGNEITGQLRFPDNRGMIFYFLQGSLLFFVTGAVFACLVAFFDLVIPRLIQYSVDAVIGEDLTSVPGWAARLAGALGGTEYLRTHLWIVALGIILAALLGAVSRYGFRVSNEKGAEAFVRRTRNQLFRHIVSLPYAWQNENSTGDILQRCTSDVETIKIFVSEQLTSLLRVFILIFMSLYFMATIQWKLTLAAAVFIPVMIISSLVFYGLIGGEFETVDSEEGRLSAIVQENLTGVRVVRTFGREQFERERFEGQNEYYTGHWIRLMRVLAAFWVSGNVIATVRNMTVAVFGAVLCVHGEMTAGGLIAFLSYNALMSLPIRSIGRVIADMSKAGVSIDRLRYIMNAEPEENPDVVLEVKKTQESEESSRNETADPRFAPMDRDIEFSHVRFRYGENTKMVLDDVSMTVRAGSTVGILGATGSGKSTLMFLLDRLYELGPEDGSIRIGGIDIREIDRGWLRQNIGMVLQEPCLFSRTLAENIAIAMPEDESSLPGTKSSLPETESSPPGTKSSPPEDGPSLPGTEPAGGKNDRAEKNREISPEKMREIRLAAQIACLDESIEKFPKGYDTFVGERGVTLSGGQKQRAAIARMLVRKTPVMIFDDSLSAVDARTDAAIRRALREKTAEATVFMIAHRVTTLQQADEIFVLEKGRIVEHGTHAELIVRGGVYSRVYALQTGCRLPDTDMLRQPNAVFTD